MGAADDPLAATDDGTRTGLPLPAALSFSRHVRLLSTVFLLVATGLVPWIVFLGVSLPPRYDAGHWNLLWIGFDVALVSVLGYAGWAAWFRRQVLASTAIVAGTLLVCDAWFDIITSIGRPDEWVTLLTGFGGELPLAAFLFWLYRRIVLENLAALHERLGSGPPPRRLRDAQLLLLSDPGPPRPEPPASAAVEEAPEGSSRS